MAEEAPPREIDGAASPAKGVQNDHVQEMRTKRPRFGATDWSALPLHPILIAAYPVLFLFAENAVQQVTLAPLWPPLAAAIGAGGVLLVVGRLVSGDWKRGALLASLALALFFSFGHAWNVVGETLGTRRWLVLVYLVIGVAGFAVILLRRGAWTTGATRALNVVAAAAVAFNVLALVSFQAGSGAASAAPAAPSGAVTMDAAAIDTKRDIYFIVLDRYPSDETLREIYGYDNSAFTDALEERGFAIAEESWAAYWKTAFSILSTLNMAHLDGPALLAEDGPRDSPTFGPVHRALQDHMAVPASLKAIGYEYIHIGNWWVPTSTNVDADLVLEWSENAEFMSALLSTTILSLLTPRDDALPDDESTEDATLARETTLYAFDRLEESAGRPGPTYVFAHLLVPHPPYVFDTDGSQPTPEEMVGRSDDDQMLRQLEWANQRVLDAIDRLTDVPSGEEPIVILQADEGPWPDRFGADQREFAWLEARPEEIQEKFGILNAVRLPGVDAREVGFGDDTSPVNTFRIIFNTYFGTNLSLLENETYLSPDYQRMYDFTPYDRELQAPAPP